MTGGAAWTEYEVPLSADADWINLTSQERESAATEDELRSVLPALERLRVRGEYRSGGDSNRLDQVVLERS